jgi:hypothetical protein
MLKFFALFFSCFYSVYADVEMLVCNVGQGNSIAVKNKNKAVVVDSGYH